uniref:PKD domain-containing protein n=1 Tax=Fulvivirga sp. TaxID=1931237 RepID=UPI00404B154E
MKFKIFICLIISITFCSGFLFGQVQHGGSPRSFQLKQSTVKNRSVNNKGEKVYISPPIKPEEDDVIGKSVKVDFTLENSGVWLDMENGDRIWRLEINTIGSLSLNILYKEFSLAEGSELYSYNCDQSEILGSYTSKNNNRHNIFQTGKVSGQCVMIELYEPSDVKGKSHFEIYEVGYFFKTEKKNNNSNKVGDAELLCHININCASASDWADEKNGVIQIQPYANGVYKIPHSGSLINNRRNDGRQLVLSSLHKLENVSEIDLLQWKFIFNYEAQSCENPVADPVGKSVLIAELLAKDVNSDFMLLEIIETIPANYSPYFNGWDRSGVIPQSGVGIHHPLGDIKKIFWDHDPLVSNSWPGTSPNSHWKTTIDIGATEPGSSGSPLFDSNSRIVGQLHGGVLTCNFPQKYYGKLSLSWEGNGSKSTRLKDWLDPDNTGAMFLEGGYFSSLEHLAITRLVSPIDHFGNDESVVVRLENNGFGGYDFSMNPVRVRASIESYFNDNTVTEVEYETLINTGSVAPGAFMNVEICNGLDLSDVGSICVDIDDRPRLANSQKSENVNLSDRTEEFNGSLQICIPNGGTTTAVNFSASLTGGYPTLTTSFTDTSDGAITSRSWSFPGGLPSSSSAAYPVVTYSNPGTYDVTLTINGSTSMTKSGYISVNSPVPITTNISVCDNSTFSNCNNSYTQYQTIYFEANTTGGVGVLSYDWTFGDGSTESGGLVSHSFDESVSYPVSLTVTDEIGTTATANTTISIGSLQPYINIDANVNDSYLTVGEGPVIFTDASESNLDLSNASYTWYFGEGAYPQLAYTKGPHQVCYDNQVKNKTISLEIVDNITGFTEYKVIPNIVFVNDNILAQCDAYLPGWETIASEFVAYGYQGCTWPNETSGVAHGDLEDYICDDNLSGPSITNCIDDPGNECWPDEFFSSHGNVKLTNNAGSAALSLFSSVYNPVDGPTETASEGVVYNHFENFQFGVEYRFKFDARTYEYSNYKLLLDHLRVSLASGMVPNANCSDNTEDPLNYLIPDYNYQSYTLGDFNYTINRISSCYEIIFTPPNNNFNQIWIYTFQEVSLVGENQNATTVTLLDNFSLYTSGSPEQCPADIIVSQSDFTSVDNYFQSGVNLRTNGGVVVADNESLEVRAGSQIKLKPGFSALEGSSFLAQIGECEVISTSGRTEKVYVSKAKYSTPKINQVQIKNKDKFDSDNEESVSSKSEIVIFPNPTQGRVTLMLPEDMFNEALEVSIVNMLGVAVLRFDISTLRNGENKLDLNSLNNGLYFVRVINGEKEYHESIVIQK